MERSLVVLADDAILRDERKYLESDACFVQLPRTAQTVYLSPASFELVCHLSTACERNEAWSFYERRCLEYGEKASSGEFESFIDDLTNRGVLERTSVPLVRERTRSNLGLKPSPTAKIPPMTFPTNVSLSLTLKCNLTCRHCLRSSSPLMKGVGELTTNEVIELIDELDANGVTSLQLTGGEITVRKDIAEIAAHIAGVRPHVQFFTNGFVLRNRLVEVLADVQRAKGEGFFVHLSMDGAGEESNDWLRGVGAYARTVEAIKQLRDADITTVVETCITPRNKAEVDQIAETCADHGVSRLVMHPISYTGRAGGDNPLFLPMSAVNRAADEVNRLAECYSPTMQIEFGYQFSPSERGPAGDGEFPLPPNTTGAGMFHMAIGADGRVYPCVESLGTAKLLMGNVRSQSTAEIWSGPRWDVFRGGWTLDELEGCRGCVFDKRCSTQACRCYAVASGLDFFSPFKDCFENAETLWDGASV